MPAAVPPYLTHRRLLGRLRAVMASTGDAQGRLNELVAIIAADMVAEVCSLYLRRAGNLLELFATHGLRAEAVHQTRLRIGEGIVGDIAAHARPMALADAKDHPLYVFRPETGEENYHSMMGVPVIRAGRVMGVLAVQNRTQRHYADEEVETLQTVAMVLAEMIAGDNLVDAAELARADGIALKPLRLEGVRLNAGLGVGRAVYHQPLLTVPKLLADDPVPEHRRLDAAVDDMHGALDDMLSADDIAAGGEHLDILETYRMIADDAGWRARIHDAIDGGLTAEAAVQKVQNELRARLSTVQDPYLRERVQDLEDLANRLMRHLLGAPDGAADALARAEDGAVILVARSMGPAQLLDYDRTRLCGLILDEGSPTSHVAIVARALDIPVVGAIKDPVGHIDEGDILVVDGDNALVFVRPTDDVQNVYAEAVRSRDALLAELAAERDLPAETLDAVRISLNVNAGLLIDMQHLADTRADGVGLYRTEIPFMARQSYPSVEDQQGIYESAMDLAQGRDVVFRTLDVGGDKVLPYWDAPGGENPAMGWRAIRVSLDRPAMLRQQLRALIRAAAGRPLSVMFPMVADISEFQRARQLLDLEINRQRDRGGPLPVDLRVGVMLEVPILALQLPSLLTHVDFLSIGSNDLLQFMFAADRGDARLADRYDMLSAPVLRFLAGIAAECAQAGVPLSLCGEMAGKPLEAMALIGIGLTKLSMAPPRLGPVKRMLRSLNVGELKAYMKTLEEAHSGNLREKLRAFARDHGVLI